MAERWSQAGGIAFAAAALAMIATPLRPRGQRSQLATVVVTSLAGATFAVAARRWGSGRAALTATGVAAATLAVERIGVTTGFPFGRYRYRGALRPTLAGVPAIVPLAWFALGVPARETAHAVLGSRSRPATRVVAGALCLTAWDAFLDPQMVGEGYWRWERPGRYRGIPASNFLGWTATGAVLMAGLEAALPLRADADAALVGLYAFVGAMSTLGFAVFFGDPLVAAVGGTAMLGPILGAVALRRRG